MEIIDRTVVERDTDSDPNYSLSPLSFRFLLSIICLERIAYYGLRSIIIFYAIDQIGLSEQKAFEQYSYLLLIVYSSNFIGGFLGDFLLGARNGILVGLSLCTLGVTFVLIPNSYLFYAGIFSIAVGSGFFKTNTFSLIAHSSSINKVILEKRFISMYGFVNLGAFLSSIVIGSLASEYGNFYSILLVLFLYILCTGLLFAIPNKFSTHTNHITSTPKEPKPITRSLLILVLVIISSSVFWIVYEQHSMGISSFRSMYASTLSSEFLQSSIWSASTIIILLVSILYYFVAKRFSMYLKFAIALILIGLCWAASTSLYSTRFLDFTVVPFLLFTLIEAVSELLIAPTAFTMISVHSSKKYYGTIFAVYSIYLYIGGRALDYSSSSYYQSLFQIGLIILLLASIVLFLILPSITKKKSTSQDPIEQDF